MFFQGQGTEHFAVSCITKQNAKKESLKKKARPQGFFEMYQLVNQAKYYHGLKKAGTYEFGMAPSL